MATSCDVCETCVSLAYRLGMLLDRMKVFAMKDKWDTAGAHLALASIEVRALKDVCKIDLSKEIADVGKAIDKRDYLGLDSAMKRVERKIEEQSIALSLSNGGEMN